MATKSLPVGIIDLVATNLHLSPADFYKSPLRDSVVAAMPDANKRNQYEKMKRDNEAIVSVLNGNDATKGLVPSKQAEYEKNAKAFCQTWFKGTVFDSCYSVLKSSDNVEATLADMRKNAVGAPPDTFATDVRNLLPGIDDATRLAAIRNGGDAITLLATLPVNVADIVAAATADDKFRNKHPELFAK